MLSCKQALIGDADFETDEIGADNAACLLFDYFAERVRQGMVERQLGKQAELAVDLKYGTSTKIERGLNPTVLVEIVIFVVRVFISLAK